MSIPIAYKKKFLKHTTMPYQTVVKKEKLHIHVLHGTYTMKTQNFIQTIYFNKLPHFIINLHIWKVKMEQKKKKLIYYLFGKIHLRSSNEVVHLPIFCTKSKDKLTHRIK